MTIPVTTRSQILISALGREGTSIGVIAKDTYWTFVFHFNTLKLKDYGGRYFYDIRDNIYGFDVSSALNTDRSKNTNRIWLWEIKLNHDLYLIELEPSPFSRPEIHDEIFIAPNVQSVEAKIFPFKFPRLTYLTINNNLVLNIYGNIKTAVPVFQQSVPWDINRRNNISFSYSLLPSKMYLVYGEPSSPDNIYEEDYFFPFPEITEITQINPLEAQISWTAVDDADNYELERAEDEDFLINVTSIYFGPDLTTTDNTPYIGTFYYRVRSWIVAAETESDWSDVKDHYIRNLYSGEGILQSSSPIIRGYGYVPQTIIAIGSLVSRESYLKGGPLGSRYWISPINSNWDQTNNWSYVSGGSPGAPVPDIMDEVYFDMNGLGNCFIDTAVNISKIYTEIGFSGVILHDSYDFTSTFGFELEDGVFLGGSGNILSKNNFNLSSIFKSSKGVLDVWGSFSYSPPVLPEESITRNYLISDYDISNKFIALPRKPNTEEIITLTVNGIPKIFETDYTTNEYYLEWMGMGLESILVESDSLNITYTAKVQEGYEHNDSQVILRTADTTLSGNYIEFYKLTLDSLNNQIRFILIESPAVVTNECILNNGYMREGTDGTVFVSNIIRDNSGFGLAIPEHNAVITADTDNTGMLYTGGILPTLVIDGNSTLMVRGQTNLFINRDLYINDGTMNMNGINVLVGSNSF